MKPLARFLSRLKDQWAAGAAAAVILGVSLLLLGCAAGVAIALAALAFGLSLSDAAINDWLLVSAIIWVPLAVGLALPGVEDIGRRLKERRRADGRASVLDRYGRPDATPDRHS